jgi:hypothetical protein
MNKPDYIHMRNLIINAVEKTACDSSPDELSDNFAELIDFLETMYISSILSLVGAMLAVAKDDEEYRTKLLSSAKELLVQPGNQIQQKLEEKYIDMIAHLDLPDCLQVKSHNEKLVEELITECEKNTT